MGRKVEFKPRIDAWAAILLLAVAAGTLALAIRSILAGPLHAGGIIRPAILPAAAAFSLWVLFGTAYEVHPDVLRIRFGPLRQRIPLGSIEEVSPDHNLMSSAALSCDRLCIVHSPSRESTYISPRERQSFLDVVEAACPHLRRDGDRLERESGGGGGRDPSKGGNPSQAKP